MYSSGKSSARTTRLRYSWPSACCNFSHSPADRPSEKAWVCEMFTAIVFGSRSAITFLSSAHWPSPHSSRLALGVAVDAIEAAVRPAPERQPLDAFLPALIVKDQNRAASRGEDCRRSERAEDGVFIVFATDHEPHRDVMFA